jgi:hypothetical protein
VPIIPDYLYTSEQKEVIPTTLNDVKFFSMEPVLTKNSTLLQCLETPVPSEKSPTLQPAPERSLHRTEKKETMANKKFVSNIKSELHAHQIQSGIHSQNLNKQSGFINGQQSNQESSEDRYHLRGNQYTKIMNQKAVYKRGDKDKYRKIGQYSNSVKHALSNQSDKFNTISEFQNAILSHDNSLTKDHNMLSTERRKKLKHEDGIQEQTKTKFQENVEYIQNVTTKTLAQNHQKYMNLKIPDYLHAWEIQHNNTAEVLSNTGQQSDLQNWSEGVESKTEPRSKQESALSNCNFRYSTIPFGQGPMATAITDSIQKSKKCSTRNF